MRGASINSAALGFNDAILDLIRNTKPVSSTSPVRFLDQLYWSAK